MKSQQVRLVDVFALGPFMVASGWMLARKEHPWMGAALALSGLATIGYNWRNYQRYEQDAVPYAPELSERSAALFGEPTYDSTGERTQGARTLRGS